MVGSAESGRSHRTTAHRAQRSGDDAKPSSDISVEPLICGYLSLSSNRRLGQCVEQRLGLFEVGGIGLTGAGTASAGKGDLYG
jgi:hypothetical protein